MRYRVKASISHKRERASVKTAEGREVGELKYCCWGERELGNQRAKVRAVVAAVSGRRRSKSKSRTGTAITIIQCCDHDGRGKVVEGTEMQQLGGLQGLGRELGDLG